MVPAYGEMSALKVLSWMQRLDTLAYEMKRVQSRVFGGTTFSVISEIES